MAKAKNAETTEATELIAVREVSDRALAAATSFDEIVALVTETHGSMVTADQELGDGFAVLSTDDKAKLEGVPFVIVDWKFHLGDQGEFVSMRIATQKGGKFIVNDGSTGIAQQLRDYEANSTRRGGILVMKGLTRSDYVNEYGAGTTYYLSTSASNELF